jgi:hypothetical protein
MENQPWLVGALVITQVWENVRVTPLISQNAAAATTHEYFTFMPFFKRADPQCQHWGIRPLGTHLNILHSVNP